MPSSHHSPPVPSITEGEPLAKDKKAPGGKIWPKPKNVPNLRGADYTEEAAARRRAFMEDETSAPLENIGTYRFDPAEVEGNVERFFGVAQIPMGLAGPLLVDGEFAQGHFFVPLATTEGTLVASYNRGMKVLAHSGGARVTISVDQMQRAPVFVFADAREARDFSHWIDANIPNIANAAEATTRVGRLLGIETVLAGKFAYLRFNFSTGDAAGQNMVSRATEAACEWIRVQCTEHRIERYYLASNIATDKKASTVNTLHTRGKRVTAEVVVPREVLRKFTRASPEQIVLNNRVGDLGTMMAGSMSNGCHTANGITALFIATGQDVANVVESASSVNYAEVTPDGDLYVAVTIPSLIVATHGGGTGLPTQNECLRMLGCTDRGSVKKFAEIVAATVLAGEISLAAAVSAGEWVSSHEQYGRNR